MWPWPWLWPWTSKPDCWKYLGKVKVKVNVDLYSVLSWTHLLRRSGMARVLKGSHSFTCTPRVHPLTGWTLPAFAFPAEAGIHLPTPDGWKAELALDTYLCKRWFKSLQWLRPTTVLWCYFGQHWIVLFVAQQSRTEVTVGLRFKLNGALVGKSSESVQCAMLKACDACADMGQL